MSTLDNLMSAFAGESQANRKYLAFATKAEAEGYHAAAKMFKAAAEAETIHAHAHLNAAEGVKSTEENLKAAVSGETFEFEEMYPPFLEEAKKMVIRKQHFHLHMLWLLRKYMLTYSKKFYQI